MRATAKQAHVLESLHRIDFTQVCRKRRAMLDGEDCRLQFVGLGARKFIRWDGHSRPVKIAEPTGIMAHAGRVRHPEPVG